MYSENKAIEPEPERENMYFGIIGECRKRVDAIRSKVGIIISPQVESVEKTATPHRTELESALKGLLIKIKDLENDIIV